MLVERQVQAGGVSLNMAVGPENGPPLLMLHGVTRRWQDFLPILPPLMLRWHVHAVDHRGHGWSDRAPRYLVTDYVEDAARLVTDQFLAPAVLVGHSLGAVVACGVAAALPDRVASLVLLDPPFDTLGAQITQTPFLSFFAGMHSLRGERDWTTSELAKALVEMPLLAPGGSRTVRLGDVRDAAQLRFGAKCLQQLDPSLFDPLLAGRWLEGFAWEDLLPKVTCPSLLLVADAAVGGMMPAPLAARVASLLPDVTRIDLPGVGHQIHWQPETACRYITAFLESL